MKKPKPVFKVLFVEDDPDRTSAGPFGQGFWLDINLYNWPK